MFRATVQIANNLKLVGGKLLAGDSTKLRAQNSKKNNYNQKKVDRHIAYTDNKLDHYNQQLAGDLGIEVMVAIPGPAPQAPDLPATLKISAISRMAAITFIHKAINLPPLGPGTKPGPVILKDTRSKHA